MKSRASTGEGCDLTCHTVENMVVKFAPVTIGPGAAMDEASVCMPGAALGPGARLLAGGSLTPALQAYLKKQQGLVQQELATRRVLARLAGEEPEPAPEIARTYWRLADDATMMEVRARPLLTSTDRLLTIRSNPHPLTPTR